MGEETCDLCGYVSQLQAAEIHHTVPKEVTEQAGLRDSATVRLCSNCHREVLTWYSAKVSSIAYDPITKRFRARSWLEMTNEYQSAFNSFAKYKKGQGKAPPPARRS